MRRGRENLFEELGRVEGERSNKNRRAEVSRIHGELNRGYKKGGQAALKPKTRRGLGEQVGRRTGRKKKPTIILSDSGIKIATVGHKNPEGLKDAKSVKGKPHSSTEGRFFSKLRTQPMVLKFKSGGAVLKGKKVGIQIK